MSDEKIYGVDGMTRQQFERDLRSRYQHDNVRRKERGIRIDLEWDEKDIQERVTLNYGKANCPGCGAFDVGMSEVTFDRECIGCQARMRAANGLGPTPKPEYVVRFEHLSGLPPTQGADARPVAILLDAAKAMMAIADPDGDATDIWAKDMRKAIALFIPSANCEVLSGDCFTSGECIGKCPEIATRDAAPSEAPKEDAKRIKQLEHALVYVAHSMHSEPQYMLAEGITLGDVSFVRVKIADIDVSVDLPESVARAMYDAAMQATATKDEERRIAIAASTPKDKS